ncbi:MAG: hypothetical protein AB7L65_05535 [Hyphomonadaceae bacterium]
MRFRHVLAAAALLALGACNQASNSAGGEGAQSQAQNAPPLDSVFPDLFQTSYRADAMILAPGETQAKPITMIRAGRKMRMEFGEGAGHTIVINDLDANQALIVSNRGGQPMAMRMGLDSSVVRDVMADWTSGRAMTPSGPCAGAGQAGTQWTMAPTQADTVPRMACVTHDGILLKATANGATTWEATSVQRGPQDAALFAPPPGVQIIEMGNLSAPARAMIERMKAKNGG